MFCFQGISTVCFRVWKIIMTIARETVAVFQTNQMTKGSSFFSGKEMMFAKSAAFPTLDSQLLCQHFLRTLYALYLISIKFPSSYIPKYLQ